MPYPLMCRTSEVSVVSVVLLFCVPYRPYWVYCVNCVSFIVCALCRGSQIYISLPVASLGSRSHLSYPLLYGTSHLSTHCASCYLVLTTRPALHVRLRILQGRLLLALHFLALSEQIQIGRPALSELSESGVPSLTRLMGCRASQGNSPISGKWESLTRARVPMLRKYCRSHG